MENPSNNIQVYLELPIFVHMFTYRSHSGSDVMICFGTKFKLSVDLVQLLKFYNGFGINLTSLS